MRHIDGPTDFEMHTQEQERVARNSVFELTLSDAIPESFCIAGRAINARVDAVLVREGESGIIFVEEIGMTEFHEVVEDGVELELRSIPKEIENMYQLRAMKRLIEIAKQTELNEWDERFAGDAA